MDRMTQSQIFIRQLCSISKVNDEFLYNTGSTHFVKIDKVLAM